MNIIGREREIQELTDLYNSKKAEFVAIYGRRRVGKTFLVNQMFENKFSFSHVGLSPYDVDEKNILKEQIHHFYNSLINYGLAKNTNEPKNWLDAFNLLRILLSSKKGDSKIVVFIDELPWMDTPKSGFLRAFEAFWNSWGCSCNRLLLIVCGSAPSWILNKLINNKGGLYDRVTYEIKLMPLKLREVKEFFNNSKTIYSDYDIVTLYMIFGGIPFYLGLINNRLSLYENIDRLFFDKNAKLKLEFNRLFESAFANPEELIRIVKFLSKKKIGYSRNEIINYLNKSSGNNITKVLDDLINCDFVMKYKSLNKGVDLYKLVDPFCLFYLRFVDDNTKLNNDFFKQNVSSQSIAIWRGLAFENVVFYHINEIKDILGIRNLSSINSIYNDKGNDEHIGTQVDLIISRADNIIDLCEMKFYGNIFEVKKDYYLNMLERSENVYNFLNSKKKSIRNILITTFGLKQNEYSSIFDDVITIEELLK